MAYRKHILLGKIAKIHGYGGAVIIRLERNFSDNLPEIESVFLEIEGRPVPFFIEYTEQADNEILRMKFEGYDNPAKVREFVGCSVFLTDAHFSGESTEDLQNLRGYRIISGKNNSIGIIKEIIHNPGQVLLVVRSGSGKDILLPLHEDLIQEINHDQKILTMILPDGLTDIN